MAIGMKKIGALGLVAAAATGLGFAATGAATAGEGSVAARLGDATKAEVVMVKWYADWCPGCKKLAPTWDDARRSMATDGVLFVKLDKTNDRKTSQAEYLCAQLDLGGMWDQYGNKTGVITLHDAGTGEMLEQFGPGTSVSEIREAVNNVR